MMETTATRFTDTTVTPQTIMVIEKNAPSEQALRAFSEKVAKLVHRGDENAA